MSLKGISIILVEPQGAWNIGSAARAMKNFGFDRLRLVNPVDFKNDSAYTAAMTARDVLDGAEVFPNLYAAIRDTAFVAGFSRRERSISIPAYNISDAVPVIFERLNFGDAALVFGREDNGLDNAEISMCDIIVSIPASPLFASLNLAQAVLLACYELYKVGGGCVGGKEGLSFATHEEMEPAFERMGLALEMLGYDDRDGGKLRGKIIQAFRHIFGRAGLEKKDVQMILGLCAKVFEKVGQKG